MKCICGKDMRVLGKITGTAKLDDPRLKLWSCPPGGCGRLFLEGTEGEITGTWYLAEKNERREEL